MTTTSNHNDTNWQPDLSAGQALLFETEHGFKGHLRINDQVFRVFLTHIDDTKDHRRAALDLSGSSPDGSSLTGRIIQNLDEAVCLRPVRPAPIVVGHITINDTPEVQFELIAWLRLSRAGARYVTGRVTQVPDTDV